MYVNVNWPLRLGGHFTAVSALKGAIDILLQLPDGDLW